MDLFSDTSYQDNYDLGLPSSFTYTKKSQTFDS